MESPSAPLFEANRLTINSGAEVPKATIVRPIIIGLICIVIAMLDEPSTSHSEPKYRRNKPMHKKKMLKIIESQSLFLLFICSI
jgi:hypothetical protein